MARLAFGGFELDPASGELRKGEDCTHIQEQPLRLLLCLLERPGQLVGREELQKRMWGGEVHVDFEDGLNAAAWRLRQVLGDSAEKPVFIETVPRKGYRFVGKVLPLPGNGPPPSGSFPMPVYRPDSGPRPRPTPESARFPRPRILWLALALALGLVAAGTGLWFAFQPRPVTVAIAPLLNGTGDPAVDYFASALSREVGRDLRAMRGMKVVFLSVAPPQGGEATRSLGAASLKLRWTLTRDPKGYLIPVDLRDPDGRSRGQAVFLATPEDLHGVHQRIADYVAARAAEGSAARRP